MNNSFDIEKLGECKYLSPSKNSYFVNDGDGILANVVVSGGDKPDNPQEIMEIAGPRKKIFFNPPDTRAAIITCGGLCPGLNDVIRGITMVLCNRYQVQYIFGLRYGYEGLVERYKHEPIMLTPSIVDDIHNDGGTILSSSRGPQEPEEMVDFLVNHKINMLFTIGGDGTQRGTSDIVNELRKRDLPISIIGIPKTIDNDLLFTDRTFGFETAVEMARLPITCAHMEANGARNGIGIVKLMGRESGFVAAYATLAAGDANLVLIPEIPFSLEKVYTYIKDRLRTKSHAVIVVAEGAGQDLLDADGVDASGNKNLADIGIFLKDKIAAHYKEIDFPVSIKYIDPSYIIRSAPASADDSAFCFQLAENAVHAAMAGRTGLVISSWNGHFVNIPVEKVTSGRKYIDPHGPLWQSVLDNTNQPVDLT